jgi:hypothetical protein
MRRAARRLRNTHRPFMKPAIADSRASVEALRIGGVVLARLPHPPEGRDRTMCMAQRGSRPSGARVQNAPWKPRRGNDRTHRLPERSAMHKGFHPLESCRDNWVEAISSFKQPADG